MTASIFSSRRGPDLGTPSLQTVPSNDETPEPLKNLYLKSLNVSNLDDLTDEQLLNKLKSLTEMGRPLLARVSPDGFGVNVRVADVVDADYLEKSDS